MMEGTDREPERHEKILWVLAGGGRWGLEIKELAWSVRLDDAGRSLFPSAEAIGLLRKSCKHLIEQGKIEERGDFFRLIQWSREPW